MQPWTTRDALFSPASYVGGVVLLVLLGMFPVIAGERDVVPILVMWIGPYLLLFVIGLVVNLLAGHRRPGCLVRRGLWWGPAVLGLPLRILGGLSFI